MSVDDLTAFIVARLDEDEAIARRNIGSAPGESIGLGDTESGGPSWPDYQTYDGTDLEVASDYINRFRPLRMLREVEAKRKIAALHGPDPSGNVCDTCHHQYPCDTLCHLAAIWSDHPDYRAEWRP